MSAPIHCTNCQHRLADNANYCTNCGHPAREVPVPAPSNQPATIHTAAPNLSATRWQLTIVYGSGEQKTFFLDHNTTIGRDPDCEIHIPDQQISRRHAIIERSSEGYAIRDLDSTNGTFVNRKRITGPTPIRFGDALTVGDYRLLVLRDTLNCGNCGQPASSNDRFCKFCGEPLSGVAAPSGEMPPVKPETPDAAPEPPAPVGETAPVEMIPPSPEPAATFLEAPIFQPAATVMEFPAAPLPKPAATFFEAPPPAAPRVPPPIPPAPLPEPPAPQKAPLWRTCLIIAAISLCGLSALAVGTYVVALLRP